jgi:lipopolysaccharide/colanic/teichoic acid biosynthesis glycosyltransferase
MIKRLFDLVFASLGLLLLSPILLAFALWIRIDSPGPVFYRGVRTGKNFKPFRMFKFRSMVSNADQIGGENSPADDPRLTEIGKFMKRYKLDELPQLINVLKSEMSLVGPRPEVLRYANLYKGEEKIVYTVKPGMTDYASIWNIHEEELQRGADDEEADRIYAEEIRPEKVRLQMKYVKEMSLWTDIKIILLTLKKIFF